MNVDIQDNTFVVAGLNNKKPYTFELSRLYALWEPGPDEEYEWIQVDGYEQTPNYILISMITASGQGGIVAVIDIEKDEIVHYHNGPYARKAWIVGGYVITLYGVQYWGVKYHNCVDAVKFGTKELVSGPKNVELGESCIFDPDRDVFLDADGDSLTIYDDFGRKANLSLGDLAG